MNTYVMLGGEKVWVDVEGYVNGDQIKHVWAQCDDCGTALDAEGEAYYRARDRSLQCGVCGSCFAIQGGKS